MARLLRICLLVITALVVEPAFGCQCVDSTTADRYSAAASVVLVTVVASREGEALSEDSRPRRVKAYRLRVRVLRSWKGKFHAGDVVDTWTPYYSLACGRSQTAVGDEFVVFSSREAELNVYSCTTSEPHRALAVVKELDVITAAQRSTLGVARFGRTYKAG
jgi:Tissue inhibitor of metalloproteinase